MWNELQKKKDLQKDFGSFVRQNFQNPQYMELI